MKKNKYKCTGIVFLVLGAVLILSALLLFLNNRNEDRRAGESAERVVRELQELLAARAEQEEGRINGGQDKGITLKEDNGRLSEEDNYKENPVATSETADGTKAEPLTEEEMTIVWLDGYGYIGYLSIPALELELPVMSEWDDERLKIAPCRQFGTAAGGNLVIAAHNYNRHFGLLKNLRNGAKVTFTDMDGNQYYYIVQEVKTLKPTAVEEVQNSKSELVLYTCTYGGKTRVAVFCEEGFES